MHEADVLPGNGGATISPAKPEGEQMHLRTLRRSTAVASVIAVAGFYSVTSAESVVVSVSGDVHDGTWSTSRDYEKTAQLIESINPQYVLGTGDMSNKDGLVSDYVEYNKAWGRFRDKTYCVPGSHDGYGSGSNSPDNEGAYFYDYFNGKGSSAGIPDPGCHTGPRGKGYWSMKIGDWLVVGLNYCATSSHKFAAGDAQCKWLDGVLAAKPRGVPVLVLEHVPRYTKCPNHKADESLVSYAWAVMMKYKPDVKLFICGHQNGVYERFVAMDNAGKADPAGIVSFTVGTGGTGSYSAGSTDSYLAKTAGGGMRGTLKLTLRANGYDFKFVPIPGKTFSDSGSVSFMATNIVRSLQVSKVSPQESPSAVYNLSGARLIGGAAAAPGNTACVRGHTIVLPKMNRRDLGL